MTHWITDEKSHTLTICDVSLCLHRKQNQSSQTGWTGSSPALENPACLGVNVHTHTFNEGEVTSIVERVQVTMVPCVNDLQVVHLGQKYVQRSSQPTGRCFHQHPWNYFAVLPPTDCSARSSASRLKPINISCLINKWKSLFCRTLKLRAKLLRYLCGIIWQLWHFLICLN